MRYLQSAYELGRLYFEMGYLSASEKVFSGLILVDEGNTASRVGLGLIKLELGLVEEALRYFKDSLSQGSFVLQSKLGLVCCFLTLDEQSRALSLLEEISSEHAPELESSPSVKTFFEALVLRIS